MRNITKRIFIGESEGKKPKKPVIMPEKARFYI